MSVDLHIYKFLTANMESPMGSGKWRQGRWRSVRGELVPCSNGLHAAPVDNLASFVNEQLWRVEVDGEHIWHTAAPMGRKLVARRMRIVERIEAWNDHTMRAWAADCAEHVLHLFEQQYPDDTRPRDAIATVRRFLAGEASREELSAVAARAAAAREAAAARAAAAAWSEAAAWSAAAARAAEAAAVAARAAAVAARAATAEDERRWQSQHLAEIVGLPWPTESERRP